MNFKVEFDVPAIQETEAGADGNVIFASFPQAKAALIAHFDQGVTDARARLAAVRALRQRDAKAGMK